jgi:hypothetical protein
MGDSTKFLAKSPYIKDLAMMVIGYGMAINIVEVTWKSKLKAAFPDPNSYSVFMGNFSSLTGVVTLLMMIGSRTIFKVSTSTSHAPKVLHPLRPAYLTLQSYFTALWLGCSSPHHSRNPTGHRSDVLQSQSLPCVLRTYHSQNRHHTAYARRDGRSGPEHSIERCEILSVRSMQGNGVHSLRPRVEDKGQSSCRRDRKSPRKIWVSSKTQ